MDTPILKNLMQLSKALVLVSDGLANLTPEDNAMLRERFTLPEPAYIETVADWIIDRVVSATFADMAIMTGANEMSVFCITCEDHTIHRRAVANGKNYYKCVKCGVVEEVGAI